MSELVKLADFVKSVEGDENVSFVVAFKKNSADEAYYAPGRGSKIDNELGDPVLMEKIKGALFNEQYVELKAMTILNAHGSPGRKLVHLPSCRHIIIT